MKKLEFVDGIIAFDIADDIISIVASDNAVLVCVTGIDAISQTVLGIDLASRIFNVDEKWLDVKPVFSQQNTHNNEIETSVTFEIISKPILLDIDVSQPVVEVAV